MKYRWYWVSAALALFLGNPIYSYAQIDSARLPNSLPIPKPTFDGKFNVIAIAGTVAEFNSFWNLASVYSQASHYSTNRAWMEGYLKAGYSFTYKSSDALSLYGGGSIVASGTAFKDIFDQGNSARVLPEEIYMGVRYTLKRSSVDLSVGQQKFVLGDGFLLSSGAGNGFERGAVTLMPRSSWKMSGLAKFKSKHISADAFLLDYNGLDDPNNNYDRLAGGDIDITGGKLMKHVGLAYINVLNSTMVYPQGLNILPDARKGLQAINGYFEVNPLEKLAPQFSLKFDYTYEWKNSINLGAHGGAVSVSNMFTSLPWTPKIKYSYRFYSGDDPNTEKLEKYDPLFYNGSPEGWASGGNGSFTFYNSNVNVHMVELDMFPSQRDIIKLFYWNLRAAKLYSPIQFGQTARTGSNGVAIIVGVEDHRLANDFYISYTRILNAKFMCSLGSAVSAPGVGLKLLAPNEVGLWVGGFVSFIYSL